MENQKIFRYGELNPGLAGLMLCLRAADASHYTITDHVRRIEVAFMTQFNQRFDLQASFRIFTKRSVVVQITQIR
jgi:hypothetical protein